MNFAMSYSGGKDSALALHRLIRQGHTPVALITTINREQGRSWFHGAPMDLLEAIGNSLDIPLIPCACAPDGYTEALERALQAARDLGAEACAFGDIDIADHKVWNEARCASAGLKCLLPLWRQDRERLTREGIAAGFKALIKIVRSDALDGSFLGQPLTPALVERIAATGSDICGENGEYHTIVIDGPIFKRPVPVRLGHIIDFGTHKAIDISLG